MNAGHFYSYWHLTAVIKKHLFNFVASGCVSKMSRFSVRSVIYGIIDAELQLLRCSKLEPTVPSKTFMMFSLRLTLQPHAIKYWDLFFL